ncbi:transmembrane emp24 domain-containing protein 6-like [Glandiceps talaboti]
MSSASLDILDEPNLQRLLVRVVISPMKGLNNNLIGNYPVLDTAGKAYTIDFQVKNPNGVIIKSLKNVEDGVYTGQTVEEGVYTVCLDNGYSRFTAKIVYLEISVFQRGEWKQYLADKMKREEDQEEIEDGMYDRLDVISENLDDVLQGQAFGRRNAIRDWYLSQSNNLYVQRWSITQCIVIVAASFCQAFFVRRMFRVSNVTPNQKPRA